MFLNQNKVNYTFFRSHTTKGSPQMGFDYLYRLASVPLSYIFWILGFSPNLISILSIFLTIVSGFVLIFVNPLLGILLFIFSYLLDFCDGNVARVINVTKPNSRSHRSITFGIILENLNTNLSLVTFVLSFSIYLYSISQSFIILYIAITYILIYLFYRYMSMHIEALAVSEHKSLTSTKTFNFFFYVKNFLSKTIFNVSSFYPIFLLSFYFLFPHILIIFTWYFFLASLYVLARFTLLVWRRAAI